jgi:putative phosphoesterase
MSRIGPEFGVTGITIDRLRLRHPAAWMFLTVPPMRVALISDLHANALALDAVLADIDRRGVDKIVCLGDVATLGPRPNLVMDRLRGLDCACIMGNHDEFMLDDDLLASYKTAPVVAEAVHWCKERLSAEDLDFLAGFRRTAEIRLGEHATLLLFHGSPRSHMEDLLATTPADDLDDLLDGRSATVMAGGHTHLQMIRQHRGILLVNPGSVGLPFKEYPAGRQPTLMSYAEYATVEDFDGVVDVGLHRVPLEKAALRNAAAASTNPLREVWLEQYA